MNILLILESKSKNKHYLNRYINFINNCSKKDRTLEKYLEVHHICPKAKDMFPEYETNSENLIKLTYKEHFLAHWMLSKIYPGTSQTLAFYYMCNNRGKRGRYYENAKKIHIELAKKRNSDPVRNAKISAKLKGRPKTKEHIQKLIGHVVSEETREKIRKKQLGKKHTEESKRKMSESRTGKTKKALSEDSKLNIAKGRMECRLQTPMGVFNTYTELAEKYNIKINTAKNIFRCLDNVPREASLKVFGLINPNKVSYRKLGFSKLPL